jgi:hypothetical protein
MLPFYAYVKMRDLPLDLPLEVNPRAQNTQSRVARQIEAGLLDDSDVFHLLNRGITMTALDASYNEKKEELSIEVAGGYYGVLDGGHTYRVISKNIAPYLAPDAKKEEEPEFLDSFVRLEVLTGIKSDLLVDIARSRVILLHRCATKASPTWKARSIGSKMLWPIPNTLARLRIARTRTMGSFLSTCVKSWRC